MVLDGSRFVTKLSSVLIWLFFIGHNNRKAVEEGKECRVSYAQREGLIGRRGGRYSAWTDECPEYQLPHTHNHTFLRFICGKRKLSWSLKSTWCVSSKTFHFSLLFDTQQPFSNEQQWIFFFCMSTWNATHCIVGQFAESSVKCIRIR